MKRAPDPEVLLVSQVWPIAGRLRVLPLKFKKSWTMRLGDIFQIIHMRHQCCDPDFSEKNDSSRSRTII